MSITYDTNDVLLRKCSLSCLDQRKTSDDSKIFDW